MGYGSSCEEVRITAIRLERHSDALSGHQDVMGVLEDVCEEALQATNFFHGGPARLEPS